jgi:proteasome beta subunit
MDNNVLKTGTTTLGILCKDCIVLAADRRVTAGSLIVSKKYQKIVPLNDRMALTIAGTVSEIQLLIKYIKAELKLKEIRTARTSTIKEAANLIAGMVYGAIRNYSTIPGIAHFLFAGVDKELHLYDLSPDGSINEVDDYVSSGSGSVFVYGVLESMYKQDMTQEEGVALAVKAISAATQRDTGSGEGVDVFVINKKGIKEVLKKTVDTRITL